MSEPQAPEVVVRRRWWRKPAVLVPAGLVMVGVITAGLLVFEPWKLVTNDVVSEALPPGALAADDTAVVTPPPPSAPSAGTPAPLASPAPQPSPSAAQPTKPGSVVVLSRGTFISQEHGTSGSVRVIQLADGSRLLRLDNLDTTNGPDLHVWLAAAPVIDGRDGWFNFDDEAYVDLGELKGNRGNQNYPIPANVDLKKLASVSIWCARFSVSFGAAALTST